MNPISPDPFNWGGIVQTVLAISFGLWAWVLKKFGEQHVTTIRELVTELKELRRELVKLSERVHAVELRQDWMQEMEIKRQNGQ